MKLDDSRRSAAQRVRWFRRGFDSGKIDNCDTFGAGQSL
jgi:predicted metalloprotease